MTGLAFTFVGFAITIAGVRRSRTAADRARMAAESVRSSIAQYDAIADLSSASAMMEEIKRLQRHRAWGVIPDRYGALRRKLGDLKGSQAPITDSQRWVFQGAIETFADLERKVERAVSSGGQPPNPAKLNDIVSAHLDELHAVLLAIQNRLRSES